MCDTFIALSEATSAGNIIFGKNSDRPYSEIQNIMFYPSQKQTNESEVQCTYIKIPQAESTYAVLLSQPLWMFGAEMGANECGVVIGNEAVWTREPLGSPALLGMDLLRLALERSTSAINAQETIVELLERYGQGGACGENDSSLDYHNSFLIADRSEAWVLETAGRWWVAERVKEHTRNISNSLSIRKDFDLAAEGIKDYALQKDLYNASDEFDFAKTFGLHWREPSSYSREGIGRDSMRKERGKITPLTMMRLLRNCESGICMHGGFRSTASMVSQLSTSGNDIHWMTGTPQPCKSFYKPIYFPDSTLDYYQAASKIKNLNAIWWSHEEVSGLKNIDFPNWNTYEEEMFLKLSDSDRMELKKTSEAAFKNELEHYQTLLSTTR